MSDSVLFLVNDLASLSPTQSTAALMATAHGRFDVWVTTLDAISVTPSGVSAACRPWTHAIELPGVEAVRTEEPIERLLDGFSAIWVRANPGRSDLQPLDWLTLLLQVQVPILNHPMGLLRAANKLHLGSLPRGTVPATWTSADPERLRGFLQTLDGPAVLKPATGTRGAGVCRTHPGDPEVSTKLQEAVAHGPALLQAYLPDAPAGDVRIHLIDGRLLEIDGAPCAVRRVPAAGEWRSNVALGGTPTHAALTAAQLTLIERVGPVLAEQGLWHVGLDVVGSHIVECNVFSPGGLQDASGFANQDFTSAVVRGFEQAL